jgi:uncharacterized protein YceH (UPF0502 family)
MHLLGGPGEMVPHESGEMKRSRDGSVMGQNAQLASRVAELEAEVAELRATIARIEGRLEAVEKEAE